MKYLKTIKAEAAKRNITLKQLADLLNISEEMFKKSTKNGSLSIDQLHTICRKLNIEVSEVFARKEHAIPKYDKLQFLNNKLFC